MSSATRESRKIVLVKGAERFEIRYDVGDEAQVTDAIGELATSGRIDWFDAALMSVELNKRMKKTGDAR